MFSFMRPHSLKIAIETHQAAIAQLRRSLERNGGIFCRREQVTGEQRRESDNWIVH